MLTCPAFPKQLPGRPERSKPYPLMPGQVVQRERDLILARRLWEAGEKAAGRDVVGVIGAGHVQVAVLHACASQLRGTVFWCGRETGGTRRVVSR